jgi:polyphenol oxidase
MNDPWPADWIRPAWNVPDAVSALATTRQGGVSQGAYRSFNLGLSSGDDDQSVSENRRRLNECLPSPPRWLNQVHGIECIHLDDWRPGIEADAAWTDRPGQVAVVLTADCLPILLASDDGSLVAAIHAGWRGLANGIIEHVVATLPNSPERLLAWIGPGISRDDYEVDEPLWVAFTQRSKKHRQAFEANARGRFQADLKCIAATELRSAGVSRVTDSRLCTAADAGHFYSHRRDHGRTGRQATLIWLSGPGALG